MLARAAPRVTRRDDRRRHRPPFRGWRSVGVVETGAPLEQETGERLRFNPWNTGGGIRPVGPFQGLRDAAYGARQRARLTACPRASASPRPASTSSATPARGRFSTL